MMYGALFLMAGAYALSRSGHVRGDFLYRTWPPRDAGQGRPRALHPVLLPGDPGADVRRLDLRRAVLAVPGGQRLQPGQHPGLSAEDADPDRRAVPVPAGRRRGLPLHRSACATGAGRCACTTSRSSRSADHPTHMQRRSVGPVGGRSSDDRAAGRDRHDAGLFIASIFLGFPIAFTLLALAVFFGFWAMDGRILNLLVTNTSDVMANDVLVAVPLFLFMGYLVERANILDRLFRSIQIAARKRAGLARGRDADHLRAVRDRDRHRRRRGHADGPARLPGDAQGRLRHPAVGRRDLRRRHARHPDPALDHADRLRRRGQRLGGPASTPRRCSRASCSPACTWSTSSAARSSTRRWRPSCRRRRSDVPLGAGPAGTLLTSSCRSRC